MFLIDTGSDVSILPVDPKAKPQPSDTVLFTADNSPVLTYGEKRIPLDLKLRRKFSWNFCVAPVSNPILGADFLAYYHLVLVLHHSCLIDTSTGLSTVGFVKCATLFDIISIGRSATFADILSE